MQTNGFESGSVIPVNSPQGDAKCNGNNKCSTPTLSTLGWNNGGAVGIGFDSDQSNTGITLDTLVLTIYGTHGTTVEGTFSLASAIDFSASDLALQPGDGNGVFAFVLTATEQTTFDSILAMSGSSLF